MAQPDLVWLIKDIDRALNARQLEAVVALFADNVVLRLVPPLPADRDTYTGKDQVRTWLQGLLTEDFLIESRHHHLLDNEVIWMSRIQADRFRRLGVDSVGWTSEAVFAGGKIRSLTITLSPVSLAKLRQNVAA